MSQTSCRLLTRPTYCDRSATSLASTSNTGATTPQKRRRGTSRPSPVPSGPPSSVRGAKARPGGALVAVSPGCSVLTRLD